MWNKLQGWKVKYHIMPIWAFCLSQTFDWLRRINIPLKFRTIFTTFVYRFPNIAKYTLVMYKELMSKYFDFSLQGSFLPCKYKWILQVEYTSWNILQFIVYLTVSWLLHKLNQHKRKAENSNNDHSLFKMKIFISLKNYGLMESEKGKSEYSSLYFVRVTRCNIMNTAYGHKLYSWISLQIPTQNKIHGMKRYKLPPEEDNKDVLPLNTMCF
jgi:hypothetical protein